MIAQVDVGNHPQPGTASGTFIAIFGLISLPFDIVLDTALLRADPIAWPFALKKAN